MFNVCLIQPPIEDFYATRIRNIPLGLLSIASVLKKNHNVQLLDLRQTKSHAAPIPADLKDVTKYYRKDDASPFGLYKQYQHFGVRSELIVNIIPENCNVFFISSLCSTYIFEAIEIIEVIRRKISKAMIIAGGSGAMFHPELFFRAGCNFIIQGEGEISSERLLDELEKPSPDLSAIPNLVWQKNGTIVRNPVALIEQLDDLPFPDYSIPGTPEYQLHKKKHVMLMASRGCPHRCKFCSIHHVFGKKYRLRSVENILAELKEKTQQGFRSFDFEDDHFGGNSRWLNQLLDGIIENFSDYDLSFQAMNGITAGNLNKDILIKMKRAGFDSINLSLVTPDRQRQKALKRPFDTQQFSRIVKIADSIGLSVTAYLIIGLPGDTPEDNLESILFLAGLPVVIGPSLYYLTPGTPDYDQFEKETTKMVSPRCYRSSYFPYDRSDFSRAAAMTLFRICRIINFLKASEKYHYTSSDYTILRNSVNLPDKLLCRQSQITLGFALYELLHQTGRIYGTGKKHGHVYPVIEELVDDDIVRKFLENYHIGIKR